MLNHSTSFTNFLLIFESGKIIPTPYSGGDSSLPPDTEAIFCFKGDRRFSFLEVTIFIPESVPHTDGYYRTYDGSTEDEFYIFDSVPLETCEVKLHQDSDLPENFDDFQYYFFPKWDEDFNAFSPENEQRLQKFYAYLCTLKKDGDE